MSLRGIVSTLCDPTVGAVISDDWCRSVTGLGADALLVPLICASDGSLPTSLYQRGMDAANRHNLPVLGRFTRGFVPVGGESATLYPNMTLYGGIHFNRLLSPYIDAVTLRMEGFARQMVRHGLVSYVAGNEYNLLGMIPQGRAVPADTDKAAALNPQVAAAFAYQAAHRLKAVGAKQVYAGSLSILPQTGLNPANNYYAAWLEAFYAFLAQQGVKPPYPFDGWVCNTEGCWGPGKLAKALGVLRSVMTRHGDMGTIVIGEWGVTNAALPAQEAALIATYGQIQAAVGNAYLFQHLGIEPYLGDPATYGAYGCVQWRIMGHEFVPGADYKMAPVARRLFAAP